MAQWVETKILKYVLLETVKVQEISKGIMMFLIFPKSKCMRNHVKIGVFSKDNDYGLGRPLGDCSQKILGNIFYGGKTSFS